MEFNLQNIRADDIKKFSYEETLDLVEKLEFVCFSPTPLIESLEFYDVCLGHARCIDEKINNNEFTPKSLNKSQKKSLQLRVNDLIHNFQISMRIDALLWERSNDAKCEMEKVRKDMKQMLKEEVKLQQKNIAELEHTTLTHVLSIMGIFSAVITIVMSVVITSTSWLNNADESSALIGFLIPNLVVLFAVSTLLALVYLLFNRGNIVQSKEKFSSKGCIAMFVVVFVLIISVLLTCILLSNIKEVNKPHIQHIISSENYTIIKKNDAEGNIKSYYSFSFENQIYEFEYYERYNHNGNLYFCVEHGALE